MKKIYITAEIGINHNGDLNIGKKIIEGAKYAGADAVKFQKRTLDDVYSKEQLNSFRESPWGKTFKEQKEGIEFDENDYMQIDNFCKNIGIEWYASAWDAKSQIFLSKFNCKNNKIASAMLTNHDLIKEIIKEKKHTFISTGMHTMEEIGAVVDMFRESKCSFELLHTVSTYPMKEEDANLKMINTLRNKFNCNVGYSGHENGRAVSCGAAALGISSLERHITLDRTMYGSDQAASLEIEGFKQLVSYIRIIEKAMGSGEKIILEEEKKLEKN